MKAITEKSKLPPQIAEFLSKKHIAVAGVSCDSQQPANAIYRKLRSVGHQVYAINPNAARVEGDACYPDLHSVPEPVEAVMVVTHPDIAVKIVRECADGNARYVRGHPSRSAMDCSTFRGAVNAVEPAWYGGVRPWAYAGRGIYACALASGHIDRRVPCQPGSCVGNSLLCDAWIVCSHALVPRDPETVRSRS